MVSFRNAGSNHLNNFMIDINCKPQLCLIRDKLSFLRTRNGCLGKLTRAHYVSTKLVDVISISFEQIKRRVAV